MSVDKTLSELWSISDHEDKEVRETVEMAINAIEILEKENLDLRYRIRKIKEFVKEG